MLKRTNILAAAIISCAIAMPVVAQDITADTVLATVNGTDVTVGHLIVMRDALPEQYDNLDDKVLFDGLLDQAIQQMVLAQTIETPSKAILLRLENERNTMLAGVAMAAEIDKSVTDEALQAAYDERFAQAEPSREYNASHILVKTEEEAADLAKQAREGADFAALAKEHSTGPSGPNGGELGWFGTGMMVPPFEEAVIKMEVGDISDPVQTQFGWHVIILNDSRLKSAPALEEVRGDLSEELQQKAIEAAIARLTDAADIARNAAEINPAILRDLSLVSGK